jgi:uroporphyrinogen decarboxylase
MNSFERVYACLQGKPVDRPPVFPQTGDHDGIIKGLTYDVMYHDLGQAVQAHLDALERYGYDFVTMQPEPSWPVAEACGATVTYPPDKNPWITEYVVASEEDLDKLSVPDFMANTTTRVIIEGTGILAKRATAPTVAFTTGPTTMALQLMPYVEVMKRIRKNPEFVHKLVSKTVDIIRAWALLLKGAGATILCICEHDVQMLSPRHFREFTVEYLPRILDIFDYNILHICGKVMPHLEYTADDIVKKLRHLTVVNVSPEVDIAALQSLLKGRIGVAGNIDHIHVLPQQGPAEVKAAVRVAIEASGGDPRFMVAPGCEITADTPPENVSAMVEATKEFATARTHRSSSV